MVAALVFLSLGAVGLLVLGIGTACLRVVRRRRPAEPQVYPPVSFIKAMAGLDDDLLQNLQSHLDLDYPGPWEVVLGLKSDKDLAYPIAKAFAQANPEKVRVVLQQGEPGHNPKVNQLITLTRAAKYELIAATDSNVRIPRGYLREVAATLAQDRVGLVCHVFTGVGEERLGAAFDNMTLCSFCGPMLAVSEVLMNMDQIIGKSICIPKKVLQQMGGWHLVKDVLAEDQQLGIQLKTLGLRSRLCASPVENIQKTQSFKQFWGRHTRWAMIRFRVLFPTVLLEPILNPCLMGLCAVLCAPESLPVWGAALAMWVAAASLADRSARITRGHGFALKWLLLFPLKELVFFAAWVRGAPMRWVNWRGNWLRVLARTRLAEPKALARVRRLRASPATELATRRR